MLKGFLLAFSFLLASAFAFSQQIETNALSPKAAVHSSKEKEALKKKEKQRVKMEKAEAQGRKNHMKLQDKATRKRMRQSRHDANRINSNKKEFFLTRWFRGRH